MNNHLLETKNIKKYFPIRTGMFARVSDYVKAIDGVSIHVDKGETLGLVGESGCGKTTLGRVILNLITPTEGEILFDDVQIHSLKSKEMRKMRREMQIIFQDPYGSLNPRMTVENIVGEPLSVFKLAKGRARRKKTIKLLEKVGLSKKYINRYPHEFSGGQRQRISIARAIALNPKFIVCDEPVSALDVSIQAQIINLLQDLQKEYHLSYLFISHDLSIVEYISDRVAVMYLGKIVELTGNKELYENPKHPYTHALLSAIPTSDIKKRRKRIILKGDVSSPINPPSGCRFHPRCFNMLEVCRNKEPELIDIGNNHLLACHNPVKK